MLSTQTTLTTKFFYSIKSDRPQRQITNSDCERTKKPCSLLIICSQFIIKMCRRFPLLTFVFNTTHGACYTGKMSSNYFSPVSSLYNLLVEAIVLGVLLLLLAVVVPTISVVLITLEVVVLVIL